MQGMIGKTASKLKEESRLNGYLSGLVHTVTGHSGISGSESTFFLAQKSQSSTIFKKKLEWRVECSQRIAFNNHFKMKSKYAYILDKCWLPGKLYNSLIPPWTGIYGNVLNFHKCPEPSAKLTSWYCYSHNRRYFFPEVTHWPLFGDSSFFFLLHHNTFSLIELYSNYSSQILIRYW